MLHGTVVVRAQMKRLPVLDPRVPAWTADLTYDRPCPFCGTEDAEALFERPDHAVVRLCSGCGCRFVAPAIAPSPLAEFYASYTEHARWRSLDASWLAELSKTNATPDDRIRRLAARGSIDRVLDVGSGSGRDVAAFRSLGAQVVAIDPNPEARAVAEALGAETISDTIEASNFENEFDVVLMHDLVEHPLDPLPMIRAAFKALRPRGALSIWTPNGESRHDVDGAGPTVFRVDLEHMQWLTPMTLTRIAQTLDAEIAHLEVGGWPDLSGFGVSAPQTTSPERVQGLTRRLSDAWDLVAHGRTRRIVEEFGDYHLYAILRRNGSQLDDNGVRLAAT